MSALELLLRVDARNHLILRTLRANGMPDVPKVVLGERPLLKASHEMNLLLDCTDRASSGQSDDAVSLKVRGAVARSGAVVDSVHSRLTIIKDPAASIYMNFNVLKNDKHVITLVELSARHNQIMPLIIRNVAVHAYGPTFVDVTVPSSISLTPETKYAVLMTYRSMHMPKCREFLNSVNLVHKNDIDMSSLVRTFVNHVPGAPFNIPLVNDSYKFLGVTHSFTYKQAPPGAGKTWTLINDAKICWEDGRFNCFIIAPTNEVVLEICSRLSERLIPHNVALSKEGMIKNLNATYSLSTNMLARKIQLENLKKSPVQFVTTLKSHSNIYVMTVNKSMTPLYDRLGIVPTIMLWDEITLTSTCTFFAVLNKNPQLIITYGDEKQGTPFEAGSRKDDNMVLYSPINVFKISGSPCHMFLRRHVRMKGPYGDLFLRHFYDVTFDFTFHSFLSSCSSFNFLSHFSMVASRHPCKEDGFGSSFKDSYLTTNTRTFSFIFPPRDTLTLTPYLAEKARLDAIVKDASVNNCRVLTFRPAQGQQSPRVFINFVKPRFSKFLTNTSVLVAVSRHVHFLSFAFMPDLPKAYAKLIVGYVYKDSISVGHNYASFVSHCVQNFNNKNLVADPKFGRDLLHDHNGDFFLKWWFYLALLERVCLISNKLNYPYEMTAFGRHVVSPPPQVAYESSVLVGYNDYYVAVGPGADAKQNSTLIIPTTPISIHRRPI